MKPSFKSLGYYLSLNYPYELVRDTEVGGYFALHPDLGGCVSQGETAEEAIQNLDNARELWLRFRIEDGLPIPEPPAPEFSGVLSLRLSTRLYSSLASVAARKGLSLELLINTVLSDFTATAEAEARSEKPKNVNIAPRRRPATRDQIFISYSHKDEKWLQALQTILKPATGHGIAVWDDTRIVVGSNWKKEIIEALNRAAVAVLLVSPHFLSSEFIANHELPPLLEAAEREGLLIHWVAVSASLYEETEIGKYQAANDPTRPLDLLGAPERKKKLVQICKKILAALRNS